MLFIYLHRNIIVVGGSMSYNSAYGEDTLARIVTNNLELPMLQNEGALPLCLIGAYNSFRIP